MKRRLKMPSPAMVVALIALFVALGGTSFAAVQLAKNSVRSKHIKNGQVKRVDLGANAVNAAKVANGTLLATDFAAGQLPKGDKGDPGPTAGFGSDNADANPSATPDDTLISQTLSLPAAGRLLVLGRFSRSTICTVGTEDVRYGLYVDNIAIPGSAAQSVSGGPIEYISVAGVTSPLPAGAHTLAIKADCLNSNPGGGTAFTDEAITAVLLGS